MDCAVFAGECPGCGRSIESRAPYNVGGKSGQWLACRACGSRLWATRKTSDEDGHHRPLADGGRPVDDPGLPGTWATAAVLIVIGAGCSVGIATIALAVLAALGVLG